jgi:hypothetical protein
MENLINLRNEITDAAENSSNKLSSIAEIIARTDDKEFDDADWNDTIMFAAKSADVSVDELLAEVVSVIGFDEFLAEEAENQYQAMMRAEDPVYGCDPYSEY